MLRMGNVVLVAHLLHSQNFPTVPARDGSVHVYVVGNKLSKVFVGRNHKYVKPFFSGSLGKRADDIVGLGIFLNDYGDVARFQKLLDYGNGLDYWLGCFGPVGFVIGKSFMTEIFTSWIKSHKQVGRFFPEDNIKKRTAKAVDG